ncbi:MAG: FecR domain-containing protein, partial [Spirochaetes bacterium]|nr:FecR domain-containing protein [Spirochaetota bacterium]
MKKLIILILVLFASADIFSAPVMKIFSGDVTVKSPGSSDWKKPFSGMTLNDGYQIKTGRAAYAAIDLGGDEIRISQNSLVEITTDMVDDQPSGFLSLFVGRLSLKMDKLKKNNQNYGIRTPTAVAAIRGTEFDIAAGADGTTLVQVKEGTVSLTGVKNTVMIGPDQESSVKIGKDPEKVKTFKPREWDAWLAESEKNLKGNELKFMKMLLENAKRLDSEIAGMEKQQAVLSAEAVNFKNKAEEFKKADDDVNWEVNMRISRDRLRKASLFGKKSSYQASRIDFMKKNAERIYLETGKPESMLAVYKKIENIHSKYY